MDKQDFSNIESLENAVKWNYFKGTLGWDIDKIAYEIDRHPRRLTEWVNSRAAAITKLLKASPGKVKAIREELEKEYPLPKAEVQKELRLEVRNVAKKYNEGNSLQELAKIFKCDPNEFRLWWNSNIKVINEQIKQLSG